MQHVRGMSYTWQYEVDSDELVETKHQWHMVMHNRYSHLNIQYR